MSADKPRRRRGEGGVSWDEQRQCFVASATVGYSAAGKRIVRRGMGKTETLARNRLKERVREYQAGLTPDARHYTVRNATEDWLSYGLAGRSGKTVDKWSSLCRTHVVPSLGARKVRELSAADVDRWLAEKAKILSSATLGSLHQCLQRILRRAMARGYVERNVVELCDVPDGQAGRPSKSLTLDQAVTLLRAAEGSSLYAYVTVSLMVGARTEELRALRWDHVDLDGQPDRTPPVPPSIQVWRSVREGGDTKTRKSRRTLALPARCVQALRLHRDRQDGLRGSAGQAWADTGLVFTSARGTAMDAANVRRAFRQTIKVAGLDPAEWTPRELRHSFVSLLSLHGVSLEQIADLVGHSGTNVTEKVYRQQLRPVLLEGAVVMDQIFGSGASYTVGNTGPQKKEDHL